MLDEICSHNTNSRDDTAGDRPLLQTTHYSAHLVTFLQGRGAAVTPATVASAVDQTKRLYKLYRSLNGPRPTEEKNASNNTAIGPGDVTVKAADVIVGTAVVTGVFKSIAASLPKAKQKARGTP